MKFTGSIAESGIHRRTNSDTFSMVTSLRNPMGVYDPTSSDNYSAIGNTLTQLDDLSGNGNHLTAATSGERPSVNTRSENGLNLVKYNGTTQRIRTSSLDFAAAQPDISLVGVFVADGQGQTDYIYGYTDATASTGRVFSMSSGDNSGNHKFTARYFNGYRGADELETLGTAYIVIHTYPSGGPHSSGRIIVNGVEPAQFGNNPNNTLTFNVTSPQFCVGDVRDTEGGFFNGAVGDLGIYNSVFTNDEINSINAYLGNKYNITVGTL